MVFDSMSKIKAVFITRSIDFHTLFSNIDFKCGITSGPTYKEEV